ncbi:hypothetical protein SAMN04487974_101251 [Pelagibacterium luteolum]|uniref:Uncharacterized protein n=1 Tax=Pelagibacterium luteolum TaxID=440168 RepID=A0A1G7S1K4_9HYPH|nr:hypothetical protein SAMN04487974_101251 [Pelagibacterium luteolum]
MFSKSCTAVNLNHGAADQFGGNGLFCQGERALRKFKMSHEMALSRLDVPVEFDCRLSILDALLKSGVAQYFFQVRCGN